VEANPAGLADYGVTPELIDNVAIPLARFNQAIGRPRSIINARKRANESIPLYIAKSDEQLGHMDRLALLLEASYPDFVAAYRDCRKVVHFAATRSLSEEEKANAEVRAAKEELLDAKRASELSGGWIAGPSCSCVLRGDPIGNVTTKDGNEQRGDRRAPTGPRFQSLTAQAEGVGRLVLQPPFEQETRVESPMHSPFGRERRLEDQVP